ncbi:aminotransferase [Phaeobacter gallaeciensis]|uniref:Aminotransferase n=2 Tax=Roseobacteraceae TaxID=2854170 RepID=A0A366XDM2_9RHOB|nr:MULTISPECIES: aminotransferase class V-fold PLP-dependent enzyme [Roseobacteraceae]MBT3142787.1 aminotransferase class V-fold PLP-dependent enzyme [Falsiruegeria litorea]MBT8168311.1 aminotransferase class V-fold PLP-dependent enzyme [Falsiruegeria litorea]RBW61466.1 aminotransferase [Phaeobacter gallaeciensis]
MTQDLRVAQGRGYLAIPGPSVMPDAVLRAMHRASPNIYEGELLDMMEPLTADLRRVARTKHHVAIYIANGHGAWEAALANVIAPGERVLVPATGRFGIGWGEMATGLGADVQVLDFGKSNPWDLDQIAEELRADAGHQIKAVLAVHVDTSSSVRNDVPALRAVLDEVGHPALLMADCIASLGCDEFEMDAWGVDVMVTGSQKGLMVPPGMGFVFFNEKAAAKRSVMPRVSRYWDWVPRANPEEFFQYFGGTAPTHHLYGLRAALDMIHEEGIEHVWARHQRLAQAIWAACETWSENGELRLNVTDRTFRSHAVTALRLDAPNGTALRNWVQKNLGLTLGIGLGMAEPGDPARDAFFRLGHMGHVNGQMIMGVLGGIQAGLSALDIPHGRGAVEAAAAVIAGR